VDPFNAVNHREHQCVRKVAPAIEFKVGLFYPEPTTVEGAADGHRSSSFVPRPLACGRETIATA